MLLHMRQIAELEFQPSSPGSRGSISVTVPEWLVIPLVDARNRNEQMGYRIGETFLLEEDKNM